MELAPRHAPGRDQLRVSRPLAASGRACVRPLRPGRAPALPTAPALALLLLLLAVLLLRCCCCSATAAAASGCAALLLQLNALLLLTAA